MKKNYLQKINIPDQPGVYFFLKGREILYIGKATSLKDRVKSYFGEDLIQTRGPIILDMTFKADKIKWQKTDSVLEALILEAELIKKHQPKYNTKEKSDKSFNYVCITQEKLPRVIIIRGKNLLQQKHENFDHTFGPFTNSTQLREALKLIRKIFPFLDEKSKNYMEFYKQINLIPDLADTRMYLQNIRNIKLFFSGKKLQILKNLQKEMTSYSKQHEFEKAGEIKRQIFALKHINDVALLKLEPKAQSLGPVFRIEAFDIAHLGGRNMVGVMVVLEDNEPAKSGYRKFKIRSQNNTNDTGALEEVLHRRLAHKEWVLPSLIVVDGGKAQLNVAKKIIQKHKLEIKVVSVLKDERHKPKALMGDKHSGIKYKKSILLANSEAHRFAIKYHKDMRAKNFLK